MICSNPAQQARGATGAGLCENGRTFLPLTDKGLP